MMWQSSLPRVSTIETWPLLCTERKWCFCAAARIASTAIRTLPSVPFLKPTGAERPEASSRCTCDSVVRAPIAPQETRSPMYCGEITSRNSQPAGTPSLLMSHQQVARDAQSLVDAETAVQVRIVDQALPADRRARFLEIDPQPLQDLSVEDRVSRTEFQYSLEDPNQRRTRNYTRKMVDELSHENVVTDVASDLQDQGLGAKLVVDRDTAARLGIAMADIDNTLYDAFGQRQVSTIFTQLNQYHVVMEVGRTSRRTPET